jgi:hypothetical protein
MVDWRVGIAAERSMPRAGPGGCHHERGRRARELFIVMATSFRDCCLLLVMALQSSRAHTRMAPQNSEPRTESTLPGEYFQKRHHSQCCPIHHREEARFSHLRPSTLREKCTFALVVIAGAVPRAALSLLMPSSQPRDSEIQPWRGAGSALPGR